MKTRIVFAILVVALFFSCNNGARTGANISLSTNIDSVSYAVGISQSKNLLTQVPEFNVDAFMAGFLDVADSTDLKISEDNVQTILQAFGKKIQERQQAKRTKELETQYNDVKKEGLDFLEANKAKNGVKVTASGLQYMVVKEGKGKKPEGPTANVTVAYKGTTPDGTEFDSNDSATFALNGVIRGWTEGVQLMKEGAKYKFFIPQELAYGANPRPGSPIKPFMPLVFEIELLKVN